MRNIVTFGEILMRFSPYISGERIIQSSLFHSCYSGAEANVAVSLAYLGEKVRFVTKLPSNILGDAAENEIRRFGIDTSFCVRGGDRLGLFFTEKGASQRASSVLYDRSGSSFSTSESYDYNWDLIFQDCEWFHISGINLAICERVSLICKEACEIAKKKGIKICFDINFRSSLISKNEFIKRLSRILPYVDLLVGNEREVTMLSEREIPLIDLDDFDKFIEKCYKSAVIVQDKFGLDTVAISLRKLKSASETSWSGMLLNGGELHVSNRYNIKIEEVLGCGDAFVAGLIHSFISEKTPKEALDFAVSASCLKHTIIGDFNLVKALEVEELMKNHVFGIVKR